MGAYSQAVAVCDEVLAKEPSNAKAFLRKGMALVSSGELSQAAQVLEAGQALDAGNRSFATWLKKCGDAPRAAPENMGTNANVGKHDAELAVLLDAHGNQGCAFVLWWVCGCEKRVLSAAVVRWWWNVVVRSCGGVA